MTFGGGGSAVRARAGVTTEQNFSSRRWLRGFLGLRHDDSAHRSSGPVARDVDGGADIPCPLADAPEAQVTVGSSRGRLLRGKSALPLPITDNLCATRPALSVASLGVLDLAERKSRARRWISELRIRGGRPSLQVRALSGGNPQKVAIG